MEYMQLAFIFMFALFGWGIGGFIGESLGLGTMLQTPSAIVSAFLVYKGTKKEK